MSLLIALAGPSRSGKGTCAEVFRARAADDGLTIRERQLSGPGKEYAASIFKPDLDEAGAIAWFEEMKDVPQDGGYGQIEVSIGAFVRQQLGLAEWTSLGDCTLQQFLQRVLQGARDRWGNDFWVDKLLPLIPASIEDFGPLWALNFMVDDKPADLALISDLRQVNEAERVKKHGGWVIEFQRPDIEHAYVTGKDHVTEKRLSELRPDLVDYIIHNDFAEHTDESLVALQAMCDSAYDWAMVRRPKEDS